MKKVSRPVARAGEHEITGARRRADVDCPRYEKPRAFSPGLLRQTAERTAHYLMRRDGWYDSTGFSRGVLR